jgi:hypothetical protein
MIFCSNSIIDNLDIKVQNYKNRHLSKEEDMKRVVTLVIIVVLGWSLSAKSETFTWTFSAPETIDGFVLYRGTSSLTCEESYTVPDPYATTYTIPEMGYFEGVRYYSAKAYFGEELSGFSNEVVIKYCGDAFCQASFTANVSYRTTTLNWEEIPGATGYQLRYKRSTDASEQVIDLSGNNHNMDLQDGTWTFNLYPKDAMGRTMECNHIYDPQTVTVVTPSPPSPPLAKIESFGANGSSSFNQTLMLAFSSTDPNSVSYVVRVYSTSSLALTGESGDVVSEATVAIGSNYCQTIDTVNYPILFVGVSAIDAYGQEGPGTIYYVLIGNLKGTVNDGVTYDLSAIDGVDLTVVKTYLRKPVTHSSSDYCNDPNLYDKLPFTPQQRSDYDLSGLTDGEDLEFYKQVNGRTGADT